jgi:hypothetical protein
MSHCHAHSQIVAGHWAVNDPFAASSMHAYDWLLTRHKHHHISEQGMRFVALCAAAKKAAPQTQLLPT